MKTITLQDEQGGEHKVNVPLGRLTPPDAVAKEIVDSLYQRSWKFALRPFVTSDRKLADRVADAIDYYVGGHEREERDGQIILTSKGYYHYIGA